jgi:hypothetical protein
MIVAHGWMYSFCALSRGAGGGGAVVTHPHCFLNCSITPAMRVFWMSTVVMFIAFV